MLHQIDIGHHGKRQNGFTLVELLAIIVILGIISSIAIVQIDNVIETSKKQAFVANAYTLKNAAQFYLKEPELDGSARFVQQLSYKNLHDLGFIDEIKDPFTKNNLDPLKNDSYVTIEDGKVTAVCLFGDTFNLCSEIQDDQVIANTPVSFSTLTIADLQPN
ncbi:prepilin-type N-terminal cleavage/methylation domain-containing protein [Falsibacillus albus]|nr:type II secretion system protein [Falsibacillus albus]